MSSREQLWYLINELLDGRYSMDVFCNEFTRIYDLEVDFDELSYDEKVMFSELCSMTGRFSDKADELLIPFVYCSGEEIIKKVTEINQKCNHM